MDVLVLPSAYHTGNVVKVERFPLNEEGVLMVQTLMANGGADAIVINPQRAMELRDFLNETYPNALLNARADGYDEGLVDGLTDYGNFPS